MSVTSTVKLTGEVIELQADTREQVVESLLYIKAYTDALDGLKKKLNAVATEMIDADGPILHNGYRLNSSVVQRMSYDETVLREVFDADELAMFTEYKKTAIDAYIAEHLDDLGDQSTLLRSTMQPTGNPYAVVRLERQK
jgi:hypothetical protein